MGIINWINVGEVSAENDKNLHHYFYDTGISKNLINNDRTYLMLGRKGAGKTAVYQHLISDRCTLFQGSDIRVPLSLQSYSWNAHALLANREKAAGFEHRDSWRFVLAVESIAAYTKSKIEKGEALSEKIKAANNLLENLFKSPTPSWIELLGEKLFSISKFKLPSFGVEEAGGLSMDAGEVSFDEIQNNPELLRNLNRNIDGLTRHLEHIIKTEIIDCRIFILFDRLDEGWVESSLTSCKEIISGLVHAADYFADHFNGIIRPVIFLREDIFLNLDINDKNKLLEDFGNTLAWSQDSLEKMILERINFYASRSGAARISQMDMLFDRQEMRNRNRPRNYILSRTFYRPRDVICFLGRTIKAMKEESQYDETINTLEQLRGEDIYSAEPGYSEWLYNELRDEWGVQKPELFEHIAHLQEINYSIFSKQSLIDRLLSGDSIKNKTEARDAIKFMFDNSVIGFKKEDNKWRFKCQRPSQGFQDTDLYKVHPGLIRGLGLTESSEELPD
ncbi:P-loop ATPase, Sll1717 family [Crenobacter luteus]|uniref:P-loop ATPase, Sll1717 family n=1 Tax=Crenobacter luteus TaxID=1452487 RepID=UPI000AE2EE05|nr:ATPase [Crenobacter luteus]